MREYKYYVNRFPLGIAYEIYRGVTCAPRDFGNVDLWRAKKDGSWSDSQDDVDPLLCLWLKGDFDPVDDEINEDQANAYLSQWRANDSWPGRE
ncbi:hypothetical protein P5Y53_08945 [Dyella jiangningensis]|uniref:hypothetical protein n=1 Tax=Dyella jiangningensis TaxID=1379159 RepID=UPI00240FE80D|nr:hypothetical protein [Dyella jiangningensis]MDG2537785.1 hypothetical protein [Dyella jiangningensis]